jgi:hypothetical protein
MENMSKKYPSEKLLYAWSSAYSGYITLVIDKVQIWQTWQQKSNNL